MQDEKKPGDDPIGSSPETNTDDLDRLASEGFYIPAGEKEPAPDQGQSTAELITALLSVTFNLLAVVRGDHWRLQPDEAVEAGNAYGAVMDKYCPDVTLGCEVTAVLTTAMIFGPRIAADKVVAAHKRAQEKAKAEEGGEDAGKAE